MSPILSSHLLLLLGDSLLHDNGKNDSVLPDISLHVLERRCHHNQYKAMLVTHRYHLQEAIALLCENDVYIWSTTYLLYDLWGYFMLKNLHNISHLVEMSSQVTVKSSAIQSMRIQCDIIIKGPSLGLFYGYFNYSGYIGYLLRHCWGEAITDDLLFSIIDCQVTKVQYL